MIRKEKEKLIYHFDAEELWIEHGEKMLSE